MSDLETIIIYAGIMQYLLYDKGALRSPESSLVVFSSLRSILPKDLAATIFELLKIHIGMSLQDALGLVPVLVTYERLPPLFYYLSETDKLYYLAIDKLKPMRKRELSAPVKEAEDARIKDNLRRIKTSSSEAMRSEQLRLEHENGVLIAEQAKALYTDGSYNEITHRVLPPLSRLEFQAILKSDARDGIRTARERYNIVGLYRISATAFSQGSVSGTHVPDLAPFHNYGMSIEETFSRVRKHHVMGSNPRKPPFHPFDGLRSNYETARLSLMAALTASETAQARIDVAQMQVNAAREVLSAETASSESTDRVLKQKQLQLLDLKKKLGAASAAFERARKESEDAKAQLESETRRFGAIHSETHRKTLEETNWSRRRIWMPKNPED